ncbi:MerR family transcriptional regulator [Aerophototrophica crusticola]|uniref:MerR family transcriptional regulator n=1 Tax=Aerophototrophica crusticola TaxID=1709002 RepID=UPI003850E948
MADPAGAGTRPAGKSATAFRTISEVSEELDVPQHVLRFWETKFPQIKPLKRGGGRRYYRPDDVELLRRIQALLYREGYTIKGVQRLLKEAKGQAAALPVGPAAKPVVSLFDDSTESSEDFPAEDELPPEDGQAVEDEAPEDTETAPAPPLVAPTRAALAPETRAGWRTCSKTCWTYGNC